MSLLFETILIENGSAFNLEYHERRMNAARYHFWQSRPITLAEHIPQNLPPEKLRCRVEYNEEVNNVIISPYVTREIKSLQVVYSDDIEYSYKYCNREKLELLFSKRKSADDILIIKGGMAADTSMANIVFTDGMKNYTPDSPLLKGTQRSSLLDAGIIEEAEITEKDISKFSSWQHVNALNPFEKKRFMPLDSIKW
jgi:4-amino-4-deoxychorismate lyase